MVLLNLSAGQDVGTGSVATAGGGKGGKKRVALTYTHKIESWWEAVTPGAPWQPRGGRWGGEWRKTQEGGGYLYILTAD